MPEDLCQRLALLAEDESRTVSNMAKVLIQQGLDRLPGPGSAPVPSSKSLRRQLERQQQAPSPKLRGRPKRIRLRGPQG